MNKIHDSLKPCLCGVAAILHEVNMGDCHRERYQIWCNNQECGWEGGVYETKEEAIKHWNTRPIEDALRAELAKYKPIPASERMPESGWNYVLLFDSISHDWEIGRLVELSENLYQWTTSEGYYWHGADFYRVTHWMPLPPAPEASHE